MPACPECSGLMKYNRNTKLYHCMRCGLVLSRKEIDDAHEKRRDLIKESRDDRYDERKKRHKDYLNWYLSKKEE
ncbi:MAG: hypothetical protein ACTSVY_12590 [Candidatus Helarchaeota archaeon]